MIAFELETFENHQQQYNAAWNLTDWSISSPYFSVLFFYTSFHRVRIIINFNPFSSSFFLFFSIFSNKYSLFEATFHQIFFEIMLFFSYSELLCCRSCWVYRKWIKLAAALSHADRFFLYSSSINEKLPKTPSRSWKKKGPSHTLLCILLP